MFFSIGKVARAGDNETRQMVRTEITAIIQSAVREVDPAAQVIVKTSLSNDKLKLPGTPFQLQGASINIPENNFPFTSLEIVLLLSDVKLLPKVKPVIESIARVYAKKLTLSSKKLPDDYVNFLSKKIPKDGFLNRRTLEKNVAELAEKTQSILKKIDNFSVKSLTEPSKKFATGAGAAGLVLLVLCLIGFAFLMHIHSESRRILQAGLRSVVEAIENGGGQTHGSANTFQQEPNAYKVTRSQGSSNDLDAIRNTSDAGLLALLADCYWTEQDEYGAFLWRRISSERKLNFLMQMPVLASYASFLSDKNETDLDFLQDPSYLNPMAIEHLDMNTVTDWVKSNPDVFAKLSPLRADALLLKPKERIVLYNSKNVSSFAGLKIPNTKSSAREFKVALRLAIKNDADELEILSIADPTVEIVAATPSLGWLLRLAPQRVAECLQRFSARDLAAGWIGPENILENLARLLPDKKKALIMSILKQNAPSRDALSFKELHRFAIQEMFAKSQVSSAEISDKNLGNRNAA